MTCRNSKTIRLKEKINRTKYHLWDISHFFMVCSNISCFVLSLLLYCMHCSIAWSLFYSHSCFFSHFLIYNKNERLVDKIIILNQIQAKRSQITLMSCFSQFLTVIRVASLSFYAEMKPPVHIQCEFCIFKILILNQKYYLLKRNIVEKQRE